MTNRRICLMICILGALVAFSATGQTSRSDDEQSPNSLPSGIAWYGVLTDGIADAKATNRPILLLAAAPQCAGVPGMW